MAARRSDVSDLRRLVTLTGIGSVDEIGALVESVFAGVSLDERQRSWLGHVIDSEGGHGALR